MNTIFLVAQAAEGGFPWGAVILVVGLIWMVAAFCEAFKPKGYTVNHKSRTDVTPK
ncbi:hypothetical protein [Aeoliella sp.]|uniref:hypothetical protein n=1 Tax=Aeoliella sp. TaxID=2795800 RepID=UPI003CCB7C97